MCATCGCDNDTQVKIQKPGDNKNDANGHYHVDSNGHYHYHTHKNNPTLHHEREIQVERDVLAQNNLIAERNRGYFEAKNIHCINLVSSPGSGKTCLLEKTILAMKETPICVIEGDQQTLNDANRINATGAPVIQINTGNGCHLDASMVHEALHSIKPDNDSLVIIENVGNLVCPSLFDLGENTRVVIMSVTEGEDKPLKYPNMFATSQLCIINKTDLLPYVEFDVKKAKEYALQINPDLQFIELSATKEINLSQWTHWLDHQVPKPVI